jgi:threonine/homoserine/homoserine lactone efflux protein
VDLIFLIKGMIIGFCVAAPVGPIGILCIRRTLRFGRLSGLFSGLGAASADMMYGAVAAFGVHFISDFVLKEKMWLHLGGGLILLVLGSRILMTKSQEEVKPITHKTLLTDFFSTFFLTLANPLTIIAFLAIFAGVGLQNHPSNALMIVLGIFWGAALWWLILSEGITLFRDRISQTFTVWINRIAGILILALGIVALTFTWCTQCRI